MWALKRLREKAWSLLKLFSRETWCCPWCTRPRHGLLWKYIACINHTVSITVRYLELFASEHKTSMPQIILSVLILSLNLTTNNVCTVQMMYIWCYCTSDLTVGMLKLIFRELYHINSGDKMIVFDQLIWLILGCFQLMSHHSAFEWQFQ